MDVLVAAREFAEAVRNADVVGIMKFVDKEGVPCIDSSVTRSEVEKHLRDKWAWLHAYYLQGREFKKRFADKAFPVSLNEVVTASGQIVMRVQPGQVSRFPCVTYEATGVSGSAEVCFMWKRKRWVLATLPNCE